MRAGLGLSKIGAAWFASTSGLKLALLAASMGAFLGLHGTETTLSPAATLAVQSTRAPVAVVTPKPKSEPAALIAAQSPERSTSSSSVPPQPNLQRSENSKVRPATVDRHHGNADLREEIRLLDSARVAIKAHQADSALEVLDAYSARFGAGAFKQEASMLRIQAVMLRGEVGRASTMAKHFVESHPHSPYASKASTIANKSPNSASVSP